MANYHVQKIPLNGTDRTHTQLDIPLYALSQLVRLTDTVPTSAH